MIKQVQKISFLWLLIFPIYGYSTNHVIVLNQIREKFFEASYNEVAYQELLRLLESQQSNSSPKIEAYRSAFLVLSAKYKNSPLEKIRLVYDGISEMNKLVEANEKDLELRFLRFSLEYHIPFILPLKRHLNDDSIFIVDNAFKVKELKLSEKFANSLFDFMKQTGYFSELQKDILRENILK